MRMNRLLPKLLLSLAAVVPAVVMAQAVMPQALPSMARWFDPASKADTIESLRALPIYQQIVNQEPVVSSQAQAAIEQRCNAEGKASIQCYGTTKVALSQAAPPYYSQCDQWKAYWTANAWSALTMRSNMCSREGNIEVSKYIIQQLQLATTHCVCN